MAIAAEDIVEISGGFSKEIDAGAMKMVFDLMQKNQYQYPVKSTIREIVSNGLDSIRERDVAVSILRGHSKVEDHFIEKDGELYKDSHFDPTYFDLKWLSNGSTVQIRYTDGGELGKDTIAIEDCGVGLGSKRLKGYFNLGFSTKRLNRFALGKFGIGAKSPLATGAPYYTITSWYNGRQYKFNVYAHRVESITPRFNMSTGKENNFIYFDNYVDRDNNPLPIYYEETTHLNGFMTEMPVKKHRKQEFLDAVTSQLLYFDNVKCYVINVDGVSTEIPVKADIIYEDDLIVMSKNSPYNKPHLLLNKVNYGYIDFRELELEEKFGNIGIKVDPERVSVNPSRETLIWDEMTRDTIVSKFNEVLEVADRIVNEGIREKDFIKWLRVCSRVSSDKWNDDSIVGRLGKIVSLTRISFKYPENPKIVFQSVFDDVEIRFHVIRMKEEREGAKIKRKVDYSPHGMYTAFREGYPIFFMANERYSHRTNKYMCTLYPEGFLVFQLKYLKENNEIPSVEEFMQIDEFENLRKKVTEASFNNKDFHERERKAQEANEERKRELQNRAQAMQLYYTYLLKSGEASWYRDVNVPEDFTGSEEEEEIVQEVKTVQAEESAAERRKLMGATIVHTPRLRYSRGSDHRVYESQKLDVPVKSIDQWTNDEIYYTSNDCEELMHMAALMTRPELDLYQAPTITSTLTAERNMAEQEWQSFDHVTRVHEVDYLRCVFFHGYAPVKLIRVAKENVKYYQDFKHITKFFKEIQNKTITMSNALIRWNTARIVKKGIDELKFLSGFKQISEEKANQYNRLSGYVDKYFRNMDIKAYGAGTDTEHVVAHLDKVTTFQLFVKENPEDKEAIAQLAKELFNPQPGVEIEDGRAIDPEIYDLYMELLEWAQPVKVMMNMVEPLVDKYIITNEQEEEIRHYFKYRNCPL